ncbi:hypothetical protein J0A67_04720 [Algoriphagus aestuariicola]|uniref:Uncharacterized protein n=1 Tax=Algoriphagus aestuariicola TaxID=1852016 RepID=A0ABS3BPG6_9BACT|nr:hypothetical protein [Algoriphagus aestuariicola]MBN7800151.1 hypothetical protein [Algoriphagus aestuariicola]
MQRSGTLGIRQTQSIASGAGNMVTAEEKMLEDGAVTPNGPMVRGDPPSGEAGTDHAM